MSCIALMVRASGIPRFTIQAARSMVIRTCYAGPMDPSLPHLSGSSYVRLPVAPISGPSCRNEVTPAGLVSRQSYSSCKAADFETRVQTVVFSGLPSIEACYTRGSALAGMKGPGTARPPGASPSPSLGRPTSSTAGSPRVPLFAKMPAMVLHLPGGATRRLSADAASPVERSSHTAHPSGAVPCPRGAGGPLPGTVQIRLAQMGEGIAECELIAWHVRVGQAVREFDKLCSVQSDKAAVDITSRYAGSITTLHFAPGDIIKVGQPIVDVLLTNAQATQDEPASSPRPPSGTDPAAHMPNVAGGSTLFGVPAARGADTAVDEGSLPAARPDALGVGTATTTGGGARSGFRDEAPGGVSANVAGDGARIATPAVRSLLKSYGLSLTDVDPSGRDGRVLKEDVLRVVAARSAAASSSPLSTSSTSPSPLSSPSANLSASSSSASSMMSPLLSAPVGREPAVGPPAAAPSPLGLALVGHGDAASISAGAALQGVWRTRGRPDQVVELRGYRRAMARSMAATTHVPLFHLGDEMCMDELADLRSAFSRDLKNDAGKSDTVGSGREANAFCGSGSSGISSSNDGSESGSISPSALPSFPQDRSSYPNTQRATGGASALDAPVNSAAAAMSGGPPSAAPPRQRLTYVPFLLKALSAALSEHPLLNSTIQVNKGGEHAGRPEDSTSRSSPPCTHVILRGRHNIGIAMDTPRGLVVPNIKDCQDRSILQIADELLRLQSLALRGALPEDDLTGGTITVSNIGSIGGTYASPIVHAHEVAIVALGRVMRVPRFNERGEVVPVSVMKITWGADHRVVDGATLARFCNTWKRFVEKPHRLLVQLA